MKKFVLFLLATCLVVGVLSACSAEDKIIGTWTSSTDVIDGVSVESRYTFMEDGKGKSTSIGIDVDFTYVIDEDAKLLTITSSVFGIPVKTEYMFEIKGNTLNLTENGKCTTYVRASEK